MLSEAKHLLLFENVGDKQILRSAQNDKLSGFHLLSGHDTRACEEECSFFVNPGSERGDLLPGDFCYPVVEANEGVAEKASEPRQ